MLNHRRGGLNPPEYTKEYTIQNIFGQIQSAPTSKMQS